MTDLKRTTQGAGGFKTGMNSDQDENNRGAEFGTTDRATRGTNRDADESGESKNLGHGHPREERGQQNS
jgi:hypothetical protein